MVLRCFLSSLDKKYAVSLSLKRATCVQVFQNDPIHTLFKLKKWENTFVSLYSFSKSYRLTGHRIGAIISSKDRLFQIEKFLDTVTICPNQLGQIGALYGLKKSTKCPPICPSDPNIKTFFFIIFIFRLFYYFLKTLIIFFKRL